MTISIPSLIYQPLFWLKTAQKMANTIKTQFWLHRSKKNKEGFVPIIIRLTYQGKRAEKATGFYVQEKDWNVSKQKVRGTGPDALRINTWINEQHSKLSVLIQQLAQEGNTFHLPSLVDSLFLKPKEEPLLLSVMLEQIEAIRKKVGKGYSHSTFEKYLFTYDKVKAFIDQELGKKDVLLKDLNVKFIMDFDQFLRVVDNNQHNTAVKYCINLKRVINVAVMQELLPRNPFLPFKTVYRDTPQVYLEEYELETLEKARLLKGSYIIVRDLFIFQCYTGLAYTDMLSLSQNDFSRDSKGRNWIVKSRQKSGIVSTIPLLPKAAAILQKYPGLIRSGEHTFPHFSIQKYNQYLGEIATLTGIHKKISSHVGRRTFGNIGLSKGISLNVISKILGHSSTLITQKVYAITTKNIISAEVIKWEPQG